ncbi:MAG: hypothetical protein ACYSWP_17735 [Planctomycetota bacterium]
MSEAQLAEISLSKLSRLNPVLLFSYIVILGPLLETLIECSLPYFVLSMLNRKKGGLQIRPWLFIFISAMLMVVTHPIQAVVGTFITGAFLAYCYAHFAFRSFGYAVLYTTGFHAAINYIGWTILVFEGST